LQEGRQQLSSVGHPLEVTIRYGELEKKISGPPEQVTQEVISFLTSVVPQLDLASRLTLSADINELAKESEGILASTPEGLVVMVPTDKLADRELVMLHLARARIAQMLGKSDKDTVQSADLAAAAKRSSGTVAGRLSELCSEGLAERKGKGEYRATTLGLRFYGEQIIPKLRSAQ